jgi:hypothetical protein
MTVIVNELEISLAPEAPLQVAPAEKPEPETHALEPLEVLALIEQRTQRTLRARAH